MSLRVAMMICIKGPVQPLTEPWSAAVGVSQLATCPSPSLCPLWLRTDIADIDRVCGGQIALAKFAYVSLGDRQIGDWRADVESSGCCGTLTSPAAGTH